MNDVVDLTRTLDDDDEWIAFWYSGAARFTNDDALDVYINREGASESQNTNMSYVFLIIDRYSTQDMSCSNDRIYTGRYFYASSAQQHDALLRTARGLGLRGGHCQHSSRMIGFLPDELLRFRRRTCSRGDGLHPVVADKSMFFGQIGSRHITFLVAQTCKEAGQEF